MRTPRKGKVYSRNYSLPTIWKNGNIYTKLSFFIWGSANIANGQIAKGLIFLAAQAAYVFYMINTGIGNLMDMRTLGTEQQGKVFDESIGIYIFSKGDNSMLILLFGVSSVVITLMAFASWLISVYSGENARKLKLANRVVPGIRTDIRMLFDKNIYRLFLAVPFLGIIVFTVMPLIYMILVAFTNYDANHQPPGNLFTWIGFSNFKSLLSTGNQLSQTFWPIFIWTMIWGFTATFSCYFGGMFLAILINSRGIKGKKLWRAVFMLTMAIPAFISLLVISTMLGKMGIINVLLQQWGFITDPLPFLTNGTWAKFTVIIVNLWIGIPSTMLIVSGILINLPAELYESAKIDGAGPVKTFTKITFPYMFFVTTPYLITQLIGNFNNFGVIFFLTGGGPLTLRYYREAGETDLLVTWLFKLTTTTTDYSLAASIAIIIFTVSAVFSLYSYSRSRAMLDEEGFQ